MQERREGAWSGWPGQTESGRFLADSATSLLLLGKKFNTSLLADYRCLRSTL